VAGLPGSFSRYLGKGKGWPPEIGGLARERHASRVDLRRVPEPGRMALRQIALPSIDPAPNLCGWRSRAVKACPTCCGVQAHGGAFGKAHCEMGVLFWLGDLDSNQD